MIYINKNNFIIKCKKIDEEYVKSIDFKKIYEEVNNLFNLNKEVKIKVHFIYSIEDYYFFHNKTFEKWICGFTNESKILFVFSPTVIETLTIHKKDRIPGIIAHETSHLFYGLSKFKQNLIINEGIAVHIMNKFSKNFTKLYDVNLESVNILDDNDMYTRGLNIVNKILQKFGKKKLINFLETNKKISDEEFAKKFKEEFK
jgi:hypothetical protein